MRLTIATFAALTASATAEVYFKEQFNNDGWKDRWTVPSSWKTSSELGDWSHTAGKHNGGSEDDKGIQTSQDARFYGLSAPLDKPYSSDNGKDLVIQYTVKHEQKIDCGGAYLKLLPGGDKFDKDKFGGDTQYAVMFGPDICGSSNKRTHVILHSNAKDENLLIKKNVNTEDNQLSHLYTLHIKPDNTFEVYIDNKSVRSGKLDDEFDFLPPKEIKDPTQSKPSDWVDEKRIPDPSDFKPEGYDDIPSEIPDPDAAKPDDWDEEDDGEWEPPMIDNPEYKGEWKAKMMDNPDYKGPWEHPMIANPEYSYDEEMYKVCKDECTHVGFELWQVKSGTIFDDIIVTDSLEEAQKFGEETFFKKKDKEKELFDAAKEKEREEEKAKREAEKDEDDYDEEEVDFMGGDEF